MDVGQTWAIIACVFFAAFGFIAVTWWAIGVHYRIGRLEARVESLDRERTRLHSQQV